MRRFFLSNNSSKSVEEYLIKLNNLGIPAKKEDVLLSTHDLLAWLSENNITKTWAVATAGMCQMMHDAGISTRDDNPDFVVLGYDTEINYEKIAKTQKPTRWYVFRAPSHEKINNIRKIIFVL